MHQSEPFTTTTSRTAFFLTRTPSCCISLCFHIHEYPAAYKLLLPSLSFQFFFLATSPRHRTDARFASRSQYSRNPIGWTLACRQRTTGGGEGALLLARDSLAFIPPSRTNSTDSPDILINSPSPIPQTAQPISSFITATASPPKRSS